MMSPEGAPPPLVPDISFVEHDAVTLEKLPQFLLECPLEVVRRLVGDIVLNGFHHGFGNREGTVSRLPCEGGKRRIGRLRVVLAHGPPGISKRRQYLSPLIYPLTVANRSATCCFNDRTRNAMLRDVKTNRCFGFLCHFALKFGFDGFDGGEAGSQFAGQGAGEFVIGDADGFVDVAQGVLGEDAVFGLAEDQADGWLVGGVAELVIDGGAVEVHLAGVFRLEVALLQFDDNEAAKLEVVEEQVEVEIPVADFQAILRPTKAKPRPSSSRNLSTWPIRPVSSSRS